MKAYKLTDQNSQTKFQTQWGENVSHTASGQDCDLCSDGWIHFYTNPLIAVLMNPVHSNFSSPKLWECETRGKELHEPLKSGCKTLTTIKEIPVPEFTNTQRIVFAILCVKKVYNDPKWNKWADEWLSGKNRTKQSAYDASYTDQVTEESPWIGTSSSAARSVARAAYYDAAYYDNLNCKGQVAEAASFIVHAAKVAAWVNKERGKLVFNLDHNNILKKLDIDFVQLAEEALKYD